MLSDRRSPTRRRAGVAATLAFLVGAVIVVVSVVLTTNDVTSQEPPVVRHGSVLGLPIAEIERTVIDDGTATSLSLRWGAWLLLVVLPAVAWLVVWGRGRSRERRDDTAPSHDA